MCLLLKVLIFIYICIYLLFKVLILPFQCGNFCMRDADCDAFYLEERDDSNCHLVDEDLTPNLPRWEAHGWRYDSVTSNRIFSKI